ncbi:MAG TPA: hypothetical protein VHA52_06490 [Candidatus Babeliaceae bacterium]|nr:hypothetical protein [Candidatus Babeliaceae bacterium]
MPNRHELFPPEIPKERVIFHPAEPVDPAEGGSFWTYYGGMYRREAWKFQSHFRTYSEYFSHQLSATFEAFLLIGSPRDHHFQHLPNHSRALLSPCDSCRIPEDS